MIPPSPPPHGHLLPPHLSLLCSAPIRPLLPPAPWRRGFSSCAEGRRMSCGFLSPHLVVPSPPHPTMIRGCSGPGDCGMYPLGDDRTVSAIGVVNHSILPIGLQHASFLRSNRLRRRWWDGNETNSKRNGIAAPRAAPALFLAAAGQAAATKRDHRPGDCDLEILKAAREKFTQEISFRNKDKDISLTKALLYVAAEDEAFMTYNRDIDACSVASERRDAALAVEVHSEHDSLESISLAGKNICEWLNELDCIAKEVEAQLVSRDIGCHLGEVLETVNAVLFESRGFRRFPVLVDSKFSYLHTVLSCGCGSAIMLSIIYIEVCQRLGVTVVGSRFGEDFLIWPQMENPEELFKVSSGHSLFAIVNGSCVEDPRSKASDLNSKSLLGLDIATNRDIIGIALANLIRLHWKRASKTNHGLMLTSPLRSVHIGHEQSGKIDNPKVPLLRPQELRLALMASERLLILQPHNWTLRRDHGMLLYYNRRYGEAVQELSICMAFAPEEEVEVLEPFVEKLHLLRLETSWKSAGQASRQAVP